MYEQGFTRGLQISTHTVKAIKTNHSGKQSRSNRFCIPGMETCTPIRKSAAEKANAFANFKEGRRLKLQFVQDFPE